MHAPDAWMVIEGCRRDVRRVLFEMDQWLQGVCGRKDLRRAAGQGMARLTAGTEGGYPSQRLPTTPAGWG